MSALHVPKLRVRVPESGRAILTTVEIDGQPWPATRVTFDSGADINGYVVVRLEFHAEIDFEAETPLALTAVREP